MSRLFADTNYLLDVMIPDRPQSSEATMLYYGALNGTNQMAASASSLKDTYYVARRFLTEPERRNWMREFLNHLAIVPIDESICHKAVDSDEPDFEDGLIRQCAEAWDADYILSRDAKAFRNSRVPRITAEELRAARS